METSCKVCFNNFNENAPPKVLECGHSLCSICIVNTLQLSPNCPVCRKDMTRNEISQYPVNYELLNLIENFNTLVMKKENFKCEIVTGLVERFTKERTLLIKEIQELDKKKEHMQFLESGLLQLKEMCETETKDLDTMKLMKVTDKLQKEFSQRIFHYKNIKTTILSLTCELGNFEDKDAYFYEIYNRIHKGEKFFAVEHVQGEVKFGEISIFGNKILIHALCLTEVDKMANIVSFQEIKKSLMNSQIYTFLKISCNLKGLQQVIIINTFTNVLATQFIKLCTGECGPMYKGVAYTKDLQNTSNYEGVMCVNNYMDNGRESFGPLEYGKHHDNKISSSHEKNDIIVFTSENCAFRILEVTVSSLYNNIVGKIIPTDLRDLIEFEDVDYLKITDSGIVIGLGQ